MSKIGKMMADTGIKSDYFDEEYFTDNYRWSISIKKNSDYITVCLANNSFNNTKYGSQSVFTIDKYSIDGHKTLIPKYLYKELENIQEKYFKG